MTEDEDVQFTVVVKGTVRTTNRKFCIESYLKDLDKLLSIRHHRCLNTDAIGTWTTTHYSLDKTIINGKEVPNLKECCKDDQIKIIDLPDDSNEVKGGEWRNIP